MKFGLKANTEESDKKTVLFCLGGGGAGIRSGCPSACHWTVLCTPQKDVCLNTGPFISDRNKFVKFFGESKINV